MLDTNQSGPGSRVKLGGEERDIVARVSTDDGPYVILTDTDGGFASVESEGLLRDREDAEYVSTTAEAKANATDATDATGDSGNATPRPRRKR